MAEVVLDGLRRAFGPVVALDRVDVEIPSGELLSLLGPWAAARRPRCARRRVRPTDRGPRSASTAATCTNVPANKRDIGMVFQAYSPVPAR